MIGIALLFVLHFVALEGADPHAATIYVEAQTSETGLGLPSTRPVRVRMYKAVDVGHQGVPTVQAVDLASLRRIEKNVPKRYRSNSWWAYASPSDSSRQFVVIYTSGA